MGELELSMLKPIHIWTKNKTFRKVLTLTVIIGLLHRNKMESSWDIMKNKS